MPELADPFQDLMAGFGLIMSLISYHLSYEQFKMQCAQMGMESTDAIEQAYQNYQQYQEEGLSLSNESIQDANEILNNTEDEMQQIMQNVYANKSYYQSMASEYKTANADSNNMYEGKRNLQLEDQYERDFLQSQNRVIAYEEQYKQFTNTKNNLIKQAIANIQKEQALVAKQKAEQAKQEQAAEKYKKKLDAIEQPTSTVDVLGQMFAPKGHTI